MSLPPVIDLDAALEPIPGQSPGGSDPRESASGTAPYYRVKDARGAARAEERGAIDTDATVPEAWNDVVEIGLTLIANEAKDLEVAAWVTEGLIRIEGFVGLRDGLILIARLVEERWDGLFPLPDEDGVETKVAPVAGLNGSGATGTLDRPIRNAKITQGSEGSYSFWDYEQAVELEKISDPSRREARIEGGAITLAAFRNSVAETPLQSLQDTLAAIGECEAALSRMSAALDIAAGNDAPSVSALQELLAAVGGCLRFVGTDRLAVSAVDDRAAGGAAMASLDNPATAGAAAQPANGAARRPGEFANREEALAQLALIAKYFRQTEPQAMLSYTIDEAIRRARMELPDLLKELAQDPDHMRYMMLAAGIKLKEQEEY